MEYEVKPPMEQNFNYQSDNFKSGGGKKKIFIVLFLIVFIVLGGLIGALYTKVWNPLWNPFRPEPKVVLSKMALKMKELKTFHVEGDFEVNNSESIGANVNLDIDRTEKENPRSKGVIKIPAVLTEIKFIQPDKDNFYLDLGILANSLETYLSYMIGAESVQEMGGFKNRWIRINEESVKKASEIFSQEREEIISIGDQLSPEKQQELNQEIIKLFIGKNFYEVKKEFPDEKIGDQLFYHYAIALEEEEIKKLIMDMVMVSLKYMPESPLTKEEYVLRMGQELQEGLDEIFEQIGEVDFEVWIGQKDNYLHRFKLDEEIGEELNSIFVEIKFSEFNQPREINAPENFIDVGKILEDIAKKMEEERKKREETMSDYRRESDIRQVSLAMEMYYDQEMKYLQSKTLPVAIGSYLDPVPQDPGNGPCSSYQWISNMSDSQQYCAWACLRDGKFFVASEKGTKKSDKAPTSLYCW